MSTLSRTAKHNLALVGVCIFVLIGVVVAVIAASPRNVTSGPVGEGTSPEQYSLSNGIQLPLVNLEGDWSMKKDGLAFIAKVADNDIKIQMVLSDGTSATYWHGTFKTADSAGSVIVSTKTEGEQEIVLSQDPTKAFSIKKDSIGFQFSAMGFSQNVELTR